MKCDYCDNLAVCKITYWTKHWLLCLECAEKNQERFDIKKSDMDKLRIQAWFEGGLNVKEEI